MKSTKHFHSEASRSYGELRPRLEAEHNNEFVTIHMDSDEHALGASSGDAMRAMRRRSTGRLVTLRIGTEPDRSD